MANDKPGNRASSEVNAGYAGEDFASGTDLLGLLTDTSREEDPFETALSLTRHAAGADLLIILRAVDANAIQCVQASPGDPVSNLLTARTVIEGVLNSGKAEFIEDYAHHPLRSRILTHWGAKSVAVMPLLTPDLEAAAMLLWKKPVHFDDTLRRVLASMVAYFRAVLPHKEVSQRLASTQERLTSILETIPQGVILIDSDSGEAWLNAAAAHLLSLSAGRASPLEVSQAMTRLDQTARRTNFRTGSRPSLHGSTSEWFWAFGEPPAQVIEVLTRNLRGTFTGQLWVLTDVTQTYMQSRELMVQSDQMASVNRELLTTKLALERRVEERTAELAEAVNRLTQNAAEQVRLQHELLRFNTDLQASNQALRQSEEALRLSERRLRLALEATGLGVFDSNPLTRAGHWDARCRAAFGIPLELPITLDTLLDTIHPDDRARMERALAAAVNPETNGRYSVEYRTLGLTDGVLRHVHVEGLAQRSEMGVQIIGTVQDITVRKRAEESLLLANNHLREFAYAAAHDLQEPLRNIANGLGLLKRKLYDRLDGANAQLIRESIASAQRMHEMVKDLLLSAASPRRRPKRYRSPMPVRFSRALRPT